MYKVIEPALGRNHSIRCAYRIDSTYCMERCAIDVGKTCSIYFVECDLLFRVGKWQGKAQTA